MKTIAIISLLFLFVYQSSAQKQHFVFEADSWKSVLKRSKIEDKPVFMQLVAENCDACKRLESEIWTDATLAENYSNNFILYAFDPKFKDTEKIKKSLKVNTYPTTLFINAKGQVIHKFLGFPSKEIMKDIAERVLSKERTLLFYNEKYARSINDFSLEDLLDYTKVRYYAGEEYSTIAQAYFKTQSLEELASPQNIEAIMLFVETIDSREFDFLARNQNNMVTENISEALVKLKVEDVISNSLNSYVLASKDLRVLNDTLDKIINFYGIADVEMVTTRVIMDYYDYVAPNNKKYFKMLNQYMTMHMLCLSPVMIGDKCQRVYEECSDTEIISNSLMWINEAMIRDVKNRSLMLISINLLIKNNRFSEARDMGEIYYQKENMEVDSPSPELLKLYKKIDDAELKFHDNQEIIKP